MYFKWVNCMVCKQYSSKKDTYAEQNKPGLKELFHTYEILK